MKPAPLGYLSAETTEEALAALHEHGAEARIIAGGQSLVAMLNMRLARPAVLVDVMRIAALASVAKNADSIVITTSPNARYTSMPQSSERCFAGHGRMMYHQNSSDVNRKQRCSAPCTVSFSSATS